MDNTSTFRKLFLPLVFLCITVSLAAQTQTPIGISNSNLPELKKQNLPAIAYDAVKSIDAANNWQDRVSIPTKVDFNFENSGEWHTLKNGDRLWRANFHCDNTYGMAFMLKNIDLPAGAYIDLYSSTGKHIFSRITSDKVGPEGNLLAGPVAGSDIILEYYEPANVKGQGNIDLFNIERMYKDYFPESVSASTNRDFGDSWECQVNINCFTENTFQDAERSVVRIIMSTEEGMVYCSGALINNTAQDMTPYVLTAFHCVSELTPMYSFYRFDFNFTSPFCNTGGEAPAFDWLMGCAQIAGYADSDFELLRIFNSVPASYNAYFAGWNRTQDYRPDTTTLIHHPVGDVKKISQEFDRLIVFNSTIDWDNDLTTSPRSHYRAFIDVGAYQGGSSGSPLFDNDGIILAQLHGGDALCDQAKAYSGRLSLSWTGGGSSGTSLKDWLDPINAGTLVQQGLDPSNAAANTGSISGRILDVNGGPMVNAKVHLNSNGNFPQSQGTMIDSTFTDEEGNYAFSNLQMSSSYFVSAANDNCSRDGLSISDITRTINHITFVNRFDDPYEYLVADVNNDGAVSVNDILFTQFLLLQFIEDFPQQQSYIIARTDMVFEEINPLPTQWQNNALIFEVSNLSGPALVPDFVAYKVGDVTFSSSGCNE